MFAPRFSSITVLFILAVCVLGCSSSKISSNKDPKFNQKVSKIYITLRVSEESWNFFRPFIYDYLQPELKKHNVESTVYNFGPLSLEGDKDVTTKVQAYNPDVLMSIVQTERKQTSRWVGNTSYGTGETGASMDIKMFLLSQDNPVWRSSLKVTGNFEVASYAAAKKATAKLIEQLKLDGIIN